MRSVFKKIGSKVSNENADEIITDPAVNPTGDTALAEAMEAQLRNEYDMIEIDSQLGDVEASIEEAEEIATVIEGAIESGEGISHESALLIDIFNRHRLNKDGMVSIAKESYVGSNRIHNARVALEGIKATIKSWWETMKKWFSDIRKKISDWYERTWSEAARIKARAEALKEASNSLPASAEKKEFEMAGAYKTLFISGKAPTPTEMVTHVTRLTTIANYAFIDNQVELNSLANGFCKCFQDSANTHEVIAKLKAFKDEEIKNKASRDAAETKAGLTDQNIKNPDYTATADKTWKTSGELLGQVCVYSSWATAAAKNIEFDTSTEVVNDLSAGNTAASPDEKMNDQTKKMETNADAATERQATTTDVLDYVLPLTNAVLGYSVTVGPFDKEIKEGSSSEVKTARGGDIGNICTKIIDICDLIIKSKINAEAAKKVSEDLEKAGNSLVNAIEKDTENENGNNANGKKFAAVLRKLYSKVSQMPQMMIKSVQKHIMDVLKALIEYCDKSAAQYKK